MNVGHLRRRAAVIRAIRSFLTEEGLVEVEPPVLVDGPALEETLEALPAADGWLHTSPEFALKRVIAAGLPRVFALTPCFRGEERGPHHGAEFTMLELYRANTGYRDLVPLVTGLVAVAAAAVGRAPPVFTCATVAELFARVGSPVPEDDDGFFFTWVDRVEPTLTEPTFVLDYPARHAALAEVRGDVAERVEVYLGGLELGNGFSELRDGDELRARFERSATARRAAGRRPHPVDEGVIAATARLPRCAGIAIGVDRLVMALTGAADIADVRVPR